MNTETFIARYATVEELRDMIVAPQLSKLKQDELIQMLHDSKAIYLGGHWELLSGNHTDVFFQFSRFAQYPKYVSRITEEILIWVDQNVSERINVALSPITAGRFLAFSVAAALNGRMNTRVVNAATDSLGKTVAKVKEGYEINADENVLILNDLITTGGGVNELIKLATESHAKPLAVCVFANRSHDAIEEVRKTSGLKVYSMIDIKAGYWPREECPLCKKGIPYRQSYHYNL